jgi:hypothetical protein
MIVPHWLGPFQVLMSAFVLWALFLLSGVHFGFRNGPSRDGLVRGLFTAAALSPIVGFALVWMLFGR